MTRLVLILAFFLNVSAMASGNWMSESDIAKVNAGLGPVTTYASIQRCEKQESPSPCMEITGKDLRTQSVQEVEIDDLSKPLYGPKLKAVGEYESLEACQSDMSSHCDDQKPGYDVRSICAKEADPAVTFELYCIADKPQGFVKRVVKQLAPDADLKSADDQRKADAAARETALSEINTRLLQCARADLVGITPAQIAQCMKAIAKQLVKTQLQLNEL